MIKFRMPLLAVRDVEISKKFYHDLFDQEVVLDLAMIIISIVMSLTLLISLLIWDLTKD